MCVMENEKKKTANNLIYQIILMGSKTTEKAMHIKKTKYNF